MSTDEGARPRARIAEARRNRVKLIAAAARAFTSGHDPVPLEAIANDAGVGIGTLYRHFPSREALVVAVYEDQIERLTVGAQELLATLPPALAFRSWIDLFVDWATTKHGMIEALRTAMASGQLEYDRMREELVAIVALFLDAGCAAGDLRSDIEATDLAATLAGVLVVAGAPAQRSQAARMLNLIVDGLRPFD